MKNIFWIITAIGILVFSVSTRLSSQEIERLVLAEKGPFDVGLMTLNLTDPNRNDKQVKIYIWYPAILTEEMMKADSTRGRQQVAAYPDDILTFQYELVLGQAGLIGSSANIKAEPTRRSALVGTVASGTFVNIVAFDGDWAQVEYGDVMGWVKSSEYVNTPQPDLSLAPYPLILYSPGFGSDGLQSAGLTQHFASYGFVAASVNHYCDGVATCLIDRPLDILFALDQLANLSDGLLRGMIDGDNVGVTGRSSGGYTALAVTGVRADPDFFIDWYPNNVTSKANIDGTLGGDDNFIDGWAIVSEYMGNLYSLEEGELWPPITDERIRASLPMVPDFSPMFGPRGLEAMTTPTLIFASTMDEFIPYEDETKPMFSDWLGDNQNLISFIDYRHAPEFNSWGLAYYKHFSTAWFAYYLQGRDDYSDYLTESFVNDFDDLVWGAYED